jgi:uncharacterized integral membrane protein (TIGR00698 family)
MLSGLQTGSTSITRLSKPVFLASAALCVTTWISAPLALTLGMILAITSLSAWNSQSRVIARSLIQFCIIALGLRIDLHNLLGAATDGLLLAVGTIAGTLITGLLLGRLLRTERETSLLVSSGTAICGGSAIAAVGSSIGATASAMGVATGAIFILNAIGLYTLPLIAHKLGMSETQFGQWAGVALHDIASVAGAAGGYHTPDNETSTVALDHANVVKLTRVLWIFPLALVFGAFARRAKRDTLSTRPDFPWFIVLFLVASGIRTILPQIAEVESTIKSIAGAGFKIALFLVGSGLSIEALKTVGWRALVQAAVLWVIVAAASAAIIMR